MNIEGKTDKQLQRMVVASWKRRMRLSIEDIKKGKGCSNTDNCAFCGKYYGDDCARCPAALKVDNYLCMGTPYSKAIGLYTEIKAGWHRKIKTFHKAVQKEIDFLKTLEC